MCVRKPDFTCPEFGRSVIPREKCSAGGVRTPRTPLYPLSKDITFSMVRPSSPMRRGRTSKRLEYIYRFFAESRLIASLLSFRYIKFNTFRTLQ